MATHGVKLTCQLFSTPCTNILPSDMLNFCFLSIIGGGEVEFVVHTQFIDSNYDKYTMTETETKNKIYIY